MLRPTSSTPLNQIPASNKPRTRASFLRRRRTGGFTLLEVLIATAVTLLMMISLAQIFKVIGDSMKQGRAALELNNRLRSVTYRVRLDLENATINPNPPADPASGEGYLKYYDGPATDYSFADEGRNLPNPVDLSRFGDVDDILMFTARAGDVWFTGKVPLSFLTGNAADTDAVTIAAQHAEIALFCEPLVSNVGNVDRNNSPLRADPRVFEKVINTDVPARYRLYYRTLLIRPDLNRDGFLSDVNGNPLRQAGLTQQLVNGTLVPLPRPTCDMVAVHQECDLSVRRLVPHDPSNPNVLSNIAANSLEDLVDPANRFAHYQTPVAGGLSMPILALSPKLETRFSELEPGQIPLRNPQIPADFQSGFLHPAFTLFGDRTGEDILASDILAFDVKAFDPGVSLIGTPGSDGALGTTANPTLGAAGSDDLVLSPNDPGFASAALSIGTPGFAVVGTGEYVDAGWGWKTYAHSRDPGNTANRIPALLSNTQLLGQFSGLAASSTAPFLHSNSLYQSGLVVQANANITVGNPPIIYQPSYDTWTTRYEGDGIFHAAVLGRRGVIRFNTGSGNNPFEVWRRQAGNYVIDAGTDGIDNPGSAAGVDDVSELETSPPFPVKLRGLKVSIRMEDPATRQIKQMSVAKEFVTQ